MKVDKSVASILRECSEDYEWRVSELAIVKKNALRKDQTPQAKIVQRRYSVPAVYAIWEGFILLNLNLYIKHVNAMHIAVTDAQDGLLAFVLFDSLKLNSPPGEFAKKEKVARNIELFMKQELRVPELVRTNGNVNFKELSLLLERYSIPKGGIERYKKELDRFVHFRDNIAHGQKNVTVTEATVLGFVKLVEDLMGDVLLDIELAIKDKTYLRARR